MSWNSPDEEKLARHEPRRPIEPRPKVLVPIDPVPEPHGISQDGMRATYRYAMSSFRRGGWLNIEAEFSPVGLVDAQAEFLFADGSRTYARPLVIGRNAFRLMVKVQEPIEEILLHVAGSGDIRHPVRVALTWPSSHRRTLALAGFAVRRLLRDPVNFLNSAMWFKERTALSRTVALPRSHRTLSERDAYARWLQLFDDRPETDSALYERQVAGLVERPLVSVLAVVGTEHEAESAIEAMAAQFYPNWELIVVTTRRAEWRGDKRDARIKFVPTTAHTRAERLNAALAAARGQIILPLPPSGRLRPHGLLEAVQGFALHPDASVIYADEDAIGPGGQRRSPRFKPAWSPHAIGSHDFIGDPIFVAAQHLRAIGGWRAGLSGAEDHDLKLRLIEPLDANAILHLPKVLLHRADPLPEGMGEGHRLDAVNEHLIRTGIPGVARMDRRSPHPRIVRNLPDRPLVSIIIPTRDRASLLRACITSILSRTHYPEYEILVLDNGSEEAETFALFKDLERDPRTRVLPRPGPFNYSALNNAGAREARGSVLALLNNDIEVMGEEDWLDEMVGYACTPGIGCVGAKLYFPNGTIQHSGIVTGLRGGAGHSDKNAAPDARGYLDRLVTVRDVSAVTAACMLVRRDVYEKVGGLDEEAYKVAFNDVDFCLRVIDAGYRNVWTPFAELIHHESISRGHDLRDPAKARRFATELATLHDRWGLRLLSDPYFSPHLDLRSEAVTIRTA